MSKPLALVIEDDPTLNKIFSITLKDDFEVESFTTGDAALAQLSKLEPALVVLDLHLPGASGKTILAAIRQEARLAKTKIILATADEREAEFQGEKADIVLLKPVSTPQLRLLAARLCKL